MLAKLAIILIFALSAISSPTSKNPQSFSFTPPEITLNRIFSTDHSWTATLSAEKLLTITAVGDIMPARTITAANPTSDFNYLYAQVKHLLVSDLAIGNLETPLTSNCQPFTDGLRFCAPPSHALAIKSAGFTVLGVANNHTYDYFDSGFAETLVHVQAAGLHAVPPNEPQFIQIKNQKIALIAVNYIPGLKNITPSNTGLSQIVATANLQADIVLVLPHWGNEYTFTPSAHQREIAHLLIDSGADLVLGSHPHWIQPVEIYHGKLIVYSHGNFVFDQYWSDPTRRGLVGKYIFYNHQLIAASLTPIYINLSGAPAPASPTQAAEWLNSLATGSIQ